MTNLSRIELYEDGHLQRVVNLYKGRHKLKKSDVLKLRKQLFLELETAALRNPEKIYWMELKTNNI